ncbi:MAG: hypothetical protein WA822_12380 [Albidovulum sp.]
MTNRIAIALALIVIGLFVAVYVWFDLGSSVFLGRKFIEFIEFIAFWR